MVLMGSGVGWPVKVEARLKVVREEKCCETGESVTYALLMGWAAGDRCSGQRRLAGDGKNGSHLIG